jgi:Na+-driven multidrug efflux pump
MKFFGVSNEVAALGKRFFRICAVFYPVLGIQCAYSAFLQGNKDVVFTSSINIMSLAVRVILS